jgi:hypothetical protein
MRVEVRAESIERERHIGASRAAPLPCIFDGIAHERMIRFRA